MNIAYFMDVSDDYIGGASVTLLNQALLMNESNRVYIVLPENEEGNYCKKLEKKCICCNLRFVVIPYKTCFRVMDIDYIQAMKSIGKIENFIREYKIDLLHSVQINIALEYVARKLKLPHLMNIYSIEKWEIGMPHYNLLPTFQSSDSNYWSEIWKKYINCYSRCIRVYDEIEDYRPQNDKKNGIVIGVCGLFVEYKNQIEIIKAAEYLIEKYNIEILFAGECETSYGKECQEYVRKRKLDSHIKFCGFVSNISDFFKQIDVLLCGSKRESFPATIVEAMSCSIPIISTPVAGVPEILIDEENAYITKSNNYVSISDAIIRFINGIENGKVTQIINKEKNTYNYYFSKDAVKTQLSDYYKYMMVHGEEHMGNIDEWNKANECIEHLVKKINLTNLAMETKNMIMQKILYYSGVEVGRKAEQCYIWGAGAYGKNAKLIIEKIWPDLQIEAFIDSKKQGIYENINIISREEIKSNQIVFIAFCGEKQEVIDYLSNIGMQIGKSIFILS